jgi:hypothetical protein
MWHRLPVFLVLLVSLSAIYSSAAYYATSKAPSQPYMAFGVYSNHALQEYISDDNFTIRPPQTTNWTLTVGNLMNVAQFAMVVVRLGNSTTQTPNSTTPAASVPELIAMQLFLGIGETSKLNFTWTVQSVNQTGGLVFPSLLINGQQTSGQLQIGAASGRNFRLIFELWTFDTGRESFQYGYPGMAGSTVGEWLQVWFNTST